MRGGWRGRMCCWWPAATDPLTRKKCSGDVLLAGGLALGCLTSEVRARQRKGRFLWSEPGGLDRTVGWRESVPGEGVAPQGGESLPAAGEELGAARSGNTEQVLEGSACPPSPGARPASPLCRLPKKSTRALASPSACPARAVCLPGRRLRQDRRVLLGHLTVCCYFTGRGGFASPPPHPAPPGHCVPCRRSAASQPSCQRSELKCLLLFRAYFLAPGPA